MACTRWTGVETGIVSYRVSFRTHSIVVLIHHTSYLIRFFQKDI